MQSKGDYLNRVHSDQMVLEIVSGEAEPNEQWPKKQLEPLGLSPLRSGCSCDGQAGRLDRHEAVAKDTQN